MLNRLPMVPVALVAAAATLLAAGPAAADPSGPSAAASAPVTSAVSAPGVTAGAANGGPSGSVSAVLLSQAARNCPIGDESQAFLAWGDQAEYTLGPDGNFTNNAASWSLSNGAGVVAGGDGFTLGDNAPSAQSLSLPDGSSASTPGFCAGVNEPTIRFLARNTGSMSSKLLVTATVSVTAGFNLVLPIADISATSSWSPTPIVPLIANFLTLLPGSQTPISLTFTPQGQGGNWQIDDLFIDPWTRGG